MIYAATGHRPDKLGGYGLETREKLRRIAREYFALSQATEIVSGMALGWDSAVAFAACDLSIPFVAAVPFKGQEKIWPEESRATYRKLLQRAARVVIVSPGGYSAEAMQARNEWMVDYCHRLVALWDGSKGGTANCIAYAETKRRKIENLWAEMAR